MNHLVIVLSSLLALPVFAQGAKPDDGMKNCPMHNQHPAHHAVVEDHGDKMMGFPHQNTTITSA